MQLFGLGTNRNLYGANLTAAGLFASGWFATAPGQFGAVAAGPTGGLASLNLGGQNATHHRLLAGTFNASGQQITGWISLTQGPYQPINNAGAVSAVFALAAADEAINDSGWINVGFFKLAPGPFKKIVVVP